MRQSRNFADEKTPADRPDALVIRTIGKPTASMIPQQSAKRSWHDRDEIAKVF